jgi:hypothetical protein
VAIDSGFERRGAVDHGRRMVEEARAFKEALGESAERFVKSVDLRGRVQRHPFGMVCAAAGAGYLLGGGLFSPVTKKALRIGVRLALIPILKNALAGLAGPGRQDEP